MESNWNANQMECNGNRSTKMLQNCAVPWLAVRVLNQVNSVCKSLSKFAVLIAKPKCCWWIQSSSIEFDGLFMQKSIIQPRNLFPV